MSEQALVYIAGPYRDPRGTAYVEDNIRAAEAVARQLWACGLAVICPHTNTRHFDGVCPDDWFLKGDLTMLARCDTIVMLPGWEKSDGAKDELSYAWDHGIRACFWSDEHDRKWLMDAGASSC